MRHVQLVVHRMPTLCTPMATAFVSRVTPILTITNCQMLITRDQLPPDSPFLSKELPEGFQIETSLSQLVRSTKSTQMDPYFDSITSTILESSAE